MIFKMIIMRIIGKFGPLGLLIESMKKYGTDSRAMAKKKLIDC